MSVNDLEVLVAANEPIETYEMVLRLYPNAKVQPLDVGDIVYKNVAIELKTWEDFINAITSKEDDRFRRQLYNFMINPEINGFYIIYGNWNEINQYSNINIKAILGAIASIQARYGLKLSIVPTKKYAIYISCKIIEKSMNRKDVRPVTYKVGSDERAVDMLVASAKNVGTEDAMRMLLHFGNVRNIINANAKELQEVHNVGKVKANNIIKTVIFDFKQKQEFEDDMNKEFGLDDFDIEKSRVKEKKEVVKEKKEVVKKKKEVVKEKKKVVETIEEADINIEEKEIEMVQEFYGNSPNENVFERCKALVVKAVELYVNKFGKGVPRARLYAALKNYPKESIEQAIRDLEIESILYQEKEGYWNKF